jgi:hypothetical protein
MSSDRLLFGSKENISSWLTSDCACSAAGRGHAGVPAPHHGRLEPCIPLALSLLPLSLLFLLLAVRLLLRLGLHLAPEGGVDLLGGGGGQEGARVASTEHVAVQRFADLVDRGLAPSSSLVECKKNLAKIILKALER